MKTRIGEIQSVIENNAAALVISEPNVFYLTGMLSSEGKVLITKQKAYFLVDFRYFETAQKTVKHLEVIRFDNLKHELKNLLLANKTEKLYTETEQLPYSVYTEYCKFFDFLTLSSENLLDNKLYELRSVKSENELEKIREAQRLTDETFSYILPRIEAGRTEIDVMLDMEFYIRRLGSRGVSFDFIVVSGKNSSLPHGVPSNKRIEKGDFVTMDFGAVVDGYRSDMTRTVAVGSVSERHKFVYNTVHSAQLAALKEIKAGQKCSDIDKIARDIIYGNGFEGCFGHSLGHSVGIEIHESPNFSPRCDQILRKGNVLTVEPGIYLENEFGVRIEDMVFVTENGCENITKSQKELIIL